MITKAQVKEIRSLASARGRDDLQAFLVEGDKLCREWLESTKHVIYVAGVHAWLYQNAALLNEHPEARILEVSDDELARISTLQTPHLALLVVRMDEVTSQPPGDEWCIALDMIQDPGNLGTIIRIADWFGVKHVVCSPGSADFYNPKVIGAAMGGHLRVNLLVAPLTGFLKSCGIPIYAATLHAAAVDAGMQHKPAVLVIGNESRGISAEVLELATREVTIPGRGGAESLNAAVSAGILLALLLPG